MAKNSSGYNVEYVLRQLNSVYCPIGSNFSFELSPRSCKALPILLYKRGEKVQAIVVIYERTINRAKLDSWRRPGSEVYEEMRRCNCRVINVFTLKKNAGINTKDLAFHCMWVYDMDDYKRLNSNKRECFLYPHNLFVYENGIKQFVNNGLLGQGQERAGVILPTGWGKTYLMARIIYDHPDRKALIVCPTRLIRDQFKEVLAPFKERVTIMTYQALLVKHANDLSSDESVPEECLRDVDIALFDEIHHSLGQEYCKAVTHFMIHYVPKIAIGFTATPMGGKERDIDSIEKHFNKRELSKIAFNEAWDYALLPSPSVICPTSKSMLGQPEIVSLVSSKEVLPNHIGTSHIEVADEAMGEMVECLRRRNIHHVLYFIDKWNDYCEAESIMKRALERAGYSDEQYRFWAIKGDENSDSEQTIIKRQFEADPEGEVDVHVLFGAVMIKEGYHPKCHVDMAVIGFLNRSDNQIIQMIGRTQFVQSSLLDDKPTYRPVIVDFFNTTAIFRKEEDYINLSGKSPSAYRGSSGGRSGDGHKPVTVISGTKMLDGEQALSNVTKEHKVDWANFEESLDEFYTNTGSVPGECRGYLDSVGRHSEKNKQLFHYFSLFLLDTNAEFHTRLKKWLVNHQEKESLRWLEPDFPGETRIGSLTDFYAISTALVKRIEFYKDHIENYESTMGSAMAVRVQAFVDKMGSKVCHAFLDLFREAYGVLPCPAMAECDERLANLVTCCSFLSSVKPAYYNGADKQEFFVLQEDVLATAWYRVLRTIETGGMVSEAMAAFTEHFAGCKEMEQLGKERNAFLDSLMMRFDSPEAMTADLLRLAVLIDRLIQAKPQTRAYELSVSMVYVKLYKWQTKVPLYLQLMGRALMACKGATIRVIGCIAQNKSNYANCFGSNGGEPNSAYAQELSVQYKETEELLPAGAKRRELVTRLKEEIASLLGKDPNASEIDMFVKRIKRPMA